MKVLFVTTHFPRKFNQSASGTFKRMRTFLEAFNEFASIRLLFYYRPELETAAGCVTEIKNAIATEWGLRNFEVSLCTQAPDETHGNRLWSGYISRMLSIHRQVGYVRTSGTTQVRAFEEALDDQPSLVFAHRLNTICPMLLTRRALPPVFLDLDDVEHKVLLREASQPPSWRSKRLLSYSQLPALFCGERQAIRFAHKTFVCSELDARYLNTKCGVTKVKPIPNSIRIPPPYPLSSKPIFLFLGTYGYAPNAVAAEYLITRLWPSIRRMRPDARLIIAGSAPERISCFAERHDGVEYTGYVDDLDTLYNQARVVCCPVLSGGGTRIKLIEAAAYGKPIVSTRIGAEGLELVDGAEILLRDDAQSFIATCLDLLQNHSLSERVGAAARRKASALYDRNNVIRLIQNEVFHSL